MKGRPAATAALALLFAVAGCTVNQADAGHRTSAGPAPEAVRPTTSEETANPMPPNDSAGNTAAGTDPAAGTGSASGSTAAPGSPGAGSAGDAVSGAAESAGRTLLTAAAAGDVPAVRAALRAGAPIESRDERGRTALLLAVTGDHVGVAEALVAAGASPDAVDDQQDTPWLVTGVTGSVPMVEVLLPANPDLTLRNRYGGVSIIPASERGHVAYVRRVVQTDIDVNHVNNLGWTALLEAVILGDGGTAHQQIVQILLDAGADPTIADRDGTTALQHASNSGYTEIVRMLEAAG